MDRTCIKVTCDVGAFFRLSATHFLLLVQKKVSKEKHTPAHRSSASLRNTLRCSLRPGGCGTRPLRGLRQSSPTAPVRSSAPRRRLRGPNTGRSKPMVCQVKLSLHTFGVFAFGAPVGDAEKRSVLRGCRRGLSEPSCEARRRVPQAPKDASIAGQPCSEAEGPSPPGSPSFGSFSWRSKKRNSPRGERNSGKATPWPA